jgi:hypothetical protein
MAGRSGRGRSQAADEATGRIQGVGFFTPLDGGAIDLVAVHQVRGKLVARPIIITNKPVAKGSSVAGVADFFHPQQPPQESHQVVAGRSRRFYQ